MTSTVYESETSTAVAEIKPASQMQIEGERKMFSPPCHPCSPQLNWMQNVETEIDVLY